MAITAVIGVGRLVKPLKTGEFQGPTVKKNQRVPLTLYHV